MLSRFLYYYTTYGNVGGVNPTLLHNSPQAAYNPPTQAPTPFNDTPQLVPPPGGTYYLYTSRESAQEIAITGLIRPSGTGWFI